MWRNLGVAFACGILFGYLALHDVQWSQIRLILHQVKWQWIGLAFVPMYLGHTLRAARWYLILRPLVKPTVWRLVAIHYVGFMLITFLPLRLGELARPLLLSQHTQLPYPSAIATAGVERLFDGLAVLLILLLGLWVAPIQSQIIPFINWPIDFMLKMAAATFIPIFIILLALLFLTTPTLNFINRILQWLPSSWCQPLMKLLENFLRGLEVLKSVKITLLVLLYSLVIWGCFTLSTYFTIIAFPVDLPFSASFTVLGIICLGIMLPGPPGFAGNYELFCKAALALFAIDANTAISYALISHLSNILMMLVTGLIALPWAPIRLARLRPTQNITDL